VNSHICYARFSRNRSVIAKTATT